MLKNISVKNYPPFHVSISRFDVYKRFVFAKLQRNLQGIWPNNQFGNGELCLEFSRIWPAQMFHKNFPWWSFVCDRNYCTRARMQNIFAIILAYWRCTTFAVLLHRKHVQIWKVSDSLFFCLFVFFSFYFLKFFILFFIRFYSYLLFLIF